MMIGAGKLRNRIRIERPSTAIDAYGHREPGWELVASVSAAIRPVGSNERLAAFQMQSGQTHVVTVRASQSLAAVSGQCRIVYGNRTFGIVGEPRNIDEADRYIVIDCTEGGADGH